MIVLLLWASLCGADPRPAAVDVLRFPNRNVVLSMRAINREYAQHCERMAQMELHRQDYWHDCLGETNRIYRIWDKLDDALAAYADGGVVPGDDVWRIPRTQDHLEDLRDLLGRENYHAARLPPPVPIWRFARID